jgi:NADH:ubiquinone oxidoreductase subunit D
LIGRTEEKRGKRKDESGKNYFPESSFIQHPSSLFHHRRYFAADGGSGAKLLAELAELNTRLRPAASPRHAEILLVFEPVSAKLAPSILELYRAMPRPRRVLVVGAAGLEHFPGAELMRMEELIPGSERVLGNHGVNEIARRMLSVVLTLDDAPAEPKLGAKAISLPEKQDREIATEFIVLSLGPLQAFTAGPLRLLLVCDGEQVVSAQVETGYSARNVAGAIMQASPAEIARLASSLDPLAPVAGRIAYVTALERLQRFEPSPIVVQQREAALALERAQNHLCWLVRFATVVANDRLTFAASNLYDELNEMAVNTLTLSTSEWIVPQGCPVAPPTDKQKIQLNELVLAITALRNQVAKDRALRLRTAGIGVLAVDRLRELGVSGPNLRASEAGAGDIMSRVLMRLDLAADDLGNVLSLALAPTNTGSVQGDSQIWSVPPGNVEVSVEGSRGQIGLSLTSDSGKFQRIAWRRPTVPVLDLLPEILAGQKLADAELIVASLDLAMAEADG